ncbi:MAG: phytoene desaturase family protein [Trueperaceae bacterium]
MASYDAVIVGSGPNGLAAALTLAKAGHKVAVYEAKDTVGGGMRTQELTLPGFKHDVCSAIHPLGLASPFFRDLPLDKFGLEWLHPEVAVAHPLEGGAVLLEKSLEQTANNLGRDKDNYQFLFQRFVENSDKLTESFLAPLLQFPQHPFLMARFGLYALRSCTMLARQCFETREARALFAGLAAHAILPLEAPATAAFGLVLGILGHAVGWPMPKGGSQTIANALASYLQSLGGEIFKGHDIKRLEELPKSKAILLDVTPQQFLRLAGEKLPASYAKTLQAFRYGAGVFKLDYALRETVPWQDKNCLRTATVHLGGTLEEIALSEYQMGQGQHPEKPYVLVAQQSLFDDTRAPTGQHTLWAYCHVPHGSTVDMTAQIESQLERFAPGFKDVVLARHSMNTKDMQMYNANYIGGDINGGAADLLQLLKRPTLGLNPYRTPLRGVYLCSSSTPPGGGVHGMCGYHAARNVLRDGPLA